MAWIPAKYARRGKLLRLRDEDGWRVVETNAALPSDSVRKRERDYQTAFPSLR